jgi:hypothetical protein
VLFSLFYALAGRLLALIVVRGRGQASKDVELILLRHEISVLRRQTPLSRAKTSARRLGLLRLLRSEVCQCQRVCSVTWALISRSGLTWLRYSGPQGV